MKSILYIYNVCVNNRMMHYLYNDIRQIDFDKYIIRIQHELWIIYYIYYIVHSKF